MRRHRLNPLQVIVMDEEDRERREPDPAHDLFRELDAKLDACVAVAGAARGGAWAAQQAGRLHALADFTPQPGARREAAERDWSGLGRPTLHLPGVSE
jgi:hypothetical protein